MPSLSQSLEGAVGKGFGQKAAIAALALVGSVCVGMPLAGASGAALSTAAVGTTPGHGPDPARWVPGATTSGATTPGATTPAATTPGATSPVTHARAADEETYNWAGVIAQGESFAGISGDWTVPAVTAAKTAAFSATWIGVGGGSQSSTGLLQLGTEQDTATGTTTYSAWVEMLPAPAYTLVTATTGTPAPVRPGDQIQAQISQVDGSTWQVEISDVTQQWQFVDTFHYTGTVATVEWIEEAPSVNTSITSLADFHSVHFTDMQTNAGAASGEQFVPIAMTNAKGVVIASPGTIESATTRSVTVDYVAPATTTGTSTSSGYDLVGSDGGVFVFDPPGQSGGFYGSLPGVHVVPNKPIVGIVPTVDDDGYFLVAADGGVFSFGNAPFLGSLPGIHVVPNKPIVGIVAANADHGYFLVGQDGGVFSFGAVPYLGSLPGDGVSADDIVGIAATPSGNGYWLIASTGQVYAFGAAQHFGTAVGTGSPVSAIAGTPTGGGYWVTTRNGAVLTFGNAKSFGTLPTDHVSPNRPIIGIVHTAGTGGYWLVGSDGGVFTFGNAPFIGALPSIASVDDIVGAVAT